MHNTIKPPDVRAALRAVQTSNADAAPSLPFQFTALTVSRLTPVRLTRPPAVQPNHIEDSTTEMFQKSIWERCYNLANDWKESNLWNAHPKSP